MSIIKGTNQIVAGFGGTKRSIGEVYFSQSALATDNPGALPGWTGEYYENGKTLFPDLYNFVKAHSELQVTKAQYDSAITTYGECPKYVIDENGASTTVLVPGYVWNVTNTGATNFRVVTKTRNPVAGDPIWASTEEQLSATGVSGLFDFSLDGDGIVYSCANDTLIVQQAAFVFGEWDPAVSGDDATLVFSKEQASLGEIQVIVGTSLRLPKYANYIKMANSTFDASRSSAVYGKSSTVTPASTTLYPWVVAYTAAIPASTAQAAEFTGALSSKADTNLGNVASNLDYVVESYNDSTNWYRKYKSGWLEQGGLVTVYGTVGATVTLLKPFATTAYNIQLTLQTTNAVGYIAATAQSISIANSKTTTSFGVQTAGIQNYEINGISWCAEGQGA